MDKPILKETILSCFLQGFRSLLRFRNPERFVDVRVTVRDLNIFREPNPPTSFSSIQMTYDAQRILG
jgi:hypothetical protein